MVLTYLMAVFSFQVTGQGRTQGNIAVACADDEAAHAEALAICSDLARDAFTKIARQADWQMSVIDEMGKTVFRFRICEDDV